MRQDSHYDYVIVGAGTAGCVLAERLSADPALRVCILEAGGQDRDPLIHVPIGLGKMQQHRLHDWGYNSEPEPGLDNRSIPALRGKVLGGSSSINYMTHVRGNAGDYDRWAANGCAGWSYAETLPYFRRYERWEDGENFWRGDHGPLSVRRLPNTDPFFEALIAAAGECGFDSNPDYNGERQDGFGRTQCTLRSGRRCSAAVAFLHPALRRPNLTLHRNAYATRILMKGRRAVGVEYLAGGEPSRIVADREVIVASGAYNSPQLLMLSGIGPADHLRGVGIVPVVDLPGVGGNLQDHPAVSLFFLRQTPGPFHALMRADRAALAMLQAYFFGTGPATAIPGGVTGFLKTGGADLAVPDVQFFTRSTALFADVWFPGLRQPYIDGFAISPVLLHPRSRGRLSLRSADPRDKPRILQNFFVEEADLRTLREGVRIARELAGRAPLKPYRSGEKTPGGEVASAEEVADWMRRTAFSANHPCATCAMGTDGQAVLDPQLRVRGVEGLRVVDASAMPDLTSGNINACVLMIADKASDLILGRPPLSPATLPP